MARAMSASLASARMKSLQPCGSAWMRASFGSRDFWTMSVHQNLPQRTQKCTSEIRLTTDLPRERAIRMIRADRVSLTSLAGTFTVLPSARALIACSQLVPRHRSHLADALLRPVDDLAQHPRRFWMPSRSFGVSASSICWRRRRSRPPSAPTGTRRGCRKALLQRADRQDAAAVERQRMDHFADRQADGEAGTALELDELAPAVFVSSKPPSPVSASKPGHCSSGKPATVALDQIGTMLSPCSPRISAGPASAGTCRRRGQIAAEAGRVELRAQADNALPRQTGALHRQIGQHIHRDC